jgi:hypothetical protein
MNMSKLEEQQSKIVSLQAEIETLKKVIGNKSEELLKVSSDKKALEKAFLEMQDEKLALLGVQADYEKLQASHTNLLAKIKFLEDLTKNLEVSLKKKDPVKGAQGAAKLKERNRLPWLKTTEEKEQGRDLTQAQKSIKDEQKQ